MILWRLHPSGARHHFVGRNESQARANERACLVLSRQRTASRMSGGGLERGAIFCHCSGGGPPRWRTTLIPNNAKGGSLGNSRRGNRVRIDVFRSVVPEHDSFEVPPVQVPGTISSDEMRARHAPVDTLEPETAWQRQDQRQVSGSGTAPVISASDQRSATDVAS
jgi:hypothetical protein